MRRREEGAEAEAARGERRPTAAANPPADAEAARTKEEEEGAEARAETAGREAIAARQARTTIIAYSGAGGAERDGRGGGERRGRTTTPSSLGKPARGKGGGALPIIRYRSSRVRT